MTKRSKNRLAVVVITLCWAVIEWMLIELRRAPYNPPHDMRTFLGTERDLVVFVMGISSVGWVLCMIMICLLTEFTGADYVYFGVMIAILTAIISGLVMFPWWPVTPYELLWN